MALTNVQSAHATPKPRRTLFRRTRRQESAVRVEHSPFPQPDRETTVIPAQRHPRPLPPTAAVHGTHPAHLMHEIVHRAMDVCANPKADHRAAYNALAPLINALSQGARSEANFDRRAQANAKAAARAAAPLQSAAQNPDIQLATETAVAQDGTVREYLPHTKDAIVAAAMRASDPRPTELQTKLTPKVLERLDAGESPESIEAGAAAWKPAVEVTVVATDAQPSPVHVPGDQVRPPIPGDAGDDETADPGADSPLARTTLPHRPRRTDSFPARLDEHGEPAEGGQVEAVDLAGTSGSYLLHMGDWCLIEGADLVGEQVHIRLASGVRDCPHMTAQVRVLGADAAERLLAQGTEAVAS